MTKFLTSKNDLDELQAYCDLISDHLTDKKFLGEELAILTNFINSGEKFPFLPDSIFKRLEPAKYICPQQTREHSFTFIDLFAGIGGFRLGLMEHGGKPLFSSEWDNKAKDCYFKNYGEYPFGDINLFTENDVSDNELGAMIPSHDILAGGFPCQPFSRAGVSARNAVGKPHGFQCTTQGTLFYSIERIARIKQPKILFLENVKNLISHDKGNTFKKIEQTINELGYEFYWQIINSETLVPQRRNRCFMVCVRKDIATTKGDFEFPNFEGGAIPLRSILEPNPDSKYTISDKLWQGHINRTSRNIERGTGFTAHLADLSKPSNTIVARYGKDGKECLIGQENKNPRMLSISECKKLFGYPEDFQLPETKTNAYRLLGNSVVVPVIEKISKAIVSQYL